mgnify:CR=1 FL=1
MILSDIDTGTLNDLTSQHVTISTDSAFISYYDPSLEAVQLTGDTVIIFYPSSGFIKIKRKGGEEYAYISLKAAQSFVAILEKLLAEREEILAELDRRGIGEEE